MLIERMNRFKENFTQNASHTRISFETSITVKYLTRTRKVKRKREFK